VGTPSIIHDIATEFDGVGQFVGQREAQPALVVAEVVGPAGCHRSDHDEGEGQGGGEAVRLVVGVHEHDLDATDPLPVAGLEARQDVGGHRGRLAGHRFQTLVEVHRHPVGGYRLEVVLGRVGGCLQARRGSEGRQQERRREEGSWGGAGHLRAG
jgi:hypothetical protein